MKKNVFCWNGLTMRKQDACEVYQEMCDEVFGKGNVTIPEVVVNNAILLHLLFVNVFASFYENLKAMLERLKVKMESADELEWLQAVVERVVDPEYGEQAYAQLVAWDVMWNMYTEGHIGLDNYEVDVLDATEGDGSPCQQAEAHKHMVMEKFGDEPVSAAVKKLNGIVLIDMVTLEGKVICHSFLNPNSCEMNDDGECCRLTQAVKQMPNGIEDNVMAVMTEVVAPTARAYGKGIEIVKGFSCPVFNKNEKVKDVKALDHVKGEAVDLKAVGLEGRDLRFENVEIAKVIVQTVEFDELVLEDVPADGIEPKSLHVSYRKGGKNRKVVLKHVSGKAVCEELSRLDMEQLMSE